jgi:hypothetical protein
MKPRGTKGQLLVQDTLISFTRIAQDEFISLTDIARVKNASEPKDVVKNWLRSRSTIDFLGLWEKINNPNFKGVEFDSFKNQAGANSFTLSPSRLPSSPPWSLKVSIKVTEAAQPSIKPVHSLTGFEPFAAIGVIVTDKLIHQLLDEACV